MHRRTSEPSGYISAVLEGGVVGYYEIGGEKRSACLVVGDGGIEDAGGGGAGDCRRALTV